VQDLGASSLPSFEELCPEAKFEIFPVDFLQPLTFEAIYPAPLPLEVDLGCGSGRFLMEMAQRFPQRNFLGVERLLGRVRKVRRKACQLKLENVRVLRLEIEYTVRFLLSAGKIARFHLNFPDPWPKRRHHPRRVADAEFFGFVYAALEPNGEIWIKTDHADYFNRITSSAAGCLHRFQEMPWEESESTLSDFEAAYREEGRPVYRLRLRKIS
jgi:tRNA (guanine-N7-)-methyltransferase